MTYCHRNGEPWRQKTRARSHSPDGPRNINSSKRYCRPGQDVCLAHVTADGNSLPKDTLKTTRARSNPQASQDRKMKEKARAILN